MKVFFSMSFRGEVSVGYLVVKHLKNLGYEITNDSFEESNRNIPELFYSWTNEQRLTHYNQVFKSLNKADLVIVESSIHSLTVGQMIQEAISLRKPLLILVREGVKLTFLDGFAESEGRLLKVEYSVDSLLPKLQEGIVYLTDQLGVRFTLILPPDIIHHLDVVSKTGVSRSEYIRKLIYDDMHRQ